MPKQRVALVLSGGVSLGSYIAGALDELMHAFHAASDRYEIDIITGASAGATTAALVAHGLLYRGGSTLLHKVWVEQLHMDGLLRPDLPPNEPVSLLSGALLRDIAQAAIRWDTPGDPGTRAPFCADDLVIAMTLSNSTALPYVSRLKQPSARGEEEFVQDRNAEQETFYLGRHLPPTDPTWQRLTQVAQASAAIPFVFPMVRLAREAANPRHYIQTPRFEGTRQWWYYDGGTYNNLPIDLAWYFIRQDSGDISDRRIVVVDPGRDEIANLTADPDYPNLLGQALDLLRDLRTESRAIQFLGEVILPSKRAMSQGDGVEALPRALPGLDQAPIELLSAFALVIPPEGAPRLRGSYLHALSAFLDQRFREYDYRRGAADARRVAREMLGIEYDAGRPDGYYEPDMDQTLHFDLSRYENLNKIPSLDDARRSVRQVFEDGLNARIAALVRRWDAPGPDLISDPILSRIFQHIALKQLPMAWGK